MDILGNKNFMPHLGLKPLFVSHLACNMVTILIVFFKTVMYFSLWALFVAWHILTCNSVVLILASIFCVNLLHFNCCYIITVENILCFA